MLKNDMKIDKMKGANRIEEKIKEWRKKENTIHIESQNMADNNFKERFKQMEINTTLLREKWRNKERERW